MPVKINRLIYALSTLLTVSMVSGCQWLDYYVDTEQKTKQYQIPDNALGIVTDSTITIKGKRLYLRDSVSTWIKVLGEPDRNSTLFLPPERSKHPLFYVWDSLGITIRTYHISEDSTKVDLVRFFDMHLTGMDSEVARKGWFERAGEFRETWKDSTEILKSYLDGRQSQIENGYIKKSAVVDSGNDHWHSYKRSRNFRRYSYPYRGLRDTVYMNGAPILSDDDVASLNARRDSVGAIQFWNVDRSSGPYSWGTTNSTGSTTVMSSTWHYNAYPVKDRDSLPLRYKLKVAGDRIHYIRVYIKDEEYW